MAASRDPGPCHCTEVARRMAREGLDDLAENIRRSHREGIGHVWLGDADSAARDEVVSHDS